MEKIDGQQQETGEYIYKVLEETNYMEVEEMISNLGRKIEEELIMHDEILRRVRES